jgi:hypothetical protein
MLRESQRFDRVAWCKWNHHENASRRNRFVCEIKVDIAAQPP